MENAKITFIVKGVFDNGAYYERKRVVVMAKDTNEARTVAKRHLEKHSDDYFQIENVRAMTENDFVVEVI